MVWAMDQELTRFDRSRADAAERALGACLSSASFWAPERITVQPAGRRFLDSRRCPIDPFEVRVDQGQRIASLLRDERTNRLQRQMQRIVAQKLDFQERHAGIDRRLPKKKRGVLGSAPPIVDEVHCRSQRPPRMNADADDISP